MINALTSEQICRIRTRKAGWLVDAFQEDLEQVEMDLTEVFDSLIATIDARDRKIKELEAKLQNVGRNES